MAYNRALQPICLECAGSEHDKDRRIAATQVGDHWVSTVFLVNDHNFGGEGPPVLWETMVFDPEGHGAQSQRYISEIQALAGHDQIVAMVREESVSRTPKTGRPGGQEG